MSTTHIVGNSYLDSQKKRGELDDIVTLIPHFDLQDLVCFYQNIDNLLSITDPPPPSSTFVSK